MTGRPSIPNASDDREAAAYWTARLKRVMTIENALRSVRSVDRWTRPPRPASRACSVKIFRKILKARRGARAHDRSLGRARHDGDGPARRNALATFQHRSDVAGDRRSACPHGHGSAVELRDTETPDFLQVGRL